MATRRIFEPKRRKVTGGKRKLYNKKLYNIHSSPHIIRVTELGGISWAMYMAHMGDTKMHTELWCRNLKERDHL
jgi:hypothetical protein